MTTVALASTASMQQRDDPNSLWVSIEVNAPSYCIARGERLLAQVNLSDSLTGRATENQSPQRSADSLLAQLQSDFERLQLNWQDCSAMVCGVGPGSFTAIRLAVAWCQGLAYGLQIPCIPINSLVRRAYGTYLTATASESSFTVISAIDARLQQYYWALYQFTADQLQTISPPQLCTQAQAQTIWDEAIQELDPLSSAPHYAQPTQIEANSSVLQWRLARSYLWPRVTAQQLAPLYIRDQVAQTIQERLLTRRTTDNLTHSDSL